MAIIIGTNSYITVAEADEYMATIKGAEKWPDETINSKEVNIVTSFRGIESATYPTEDEAKQAQLSELRLVYTQWDNYNRHKTIQSLGAKRLKNSKSEVEYFSRKEQVPDPNEGAYGNDIVDACC